MASASSHTATATLTLTQVLGHYRSLSDEQTIARIIKLLGSKTEDKAALSQGTMFEYENCLNLLAYRLSTEHTGKHRNSFPTMAEILLRPNGPTWLAQQVPEASERRKLATVFASVVQRAFANLCSDAHESMASMHERCPQAVHAAEKRSRVWWSHVSV